MILYRAGKPGETTAGYSNFFASTPGHAQRYQSFHEAGIFTDRDRSVIYRTDVIVKPDEVADLTSRRKQLFATLEGPNGVLKNLDSWRDRGYRWLVYPDWLGMAWVYVGHEPLALVPQ